MVVNIFADVILSLLSPSPVAPNTGPHGPTFSSFVIVLHIALAVFVTGECVAVLYYWLGRSWARWLVLFGCIFYLVGLKDLASQWRLHHSVMNASLTIGSAALAVYLLWYLHTGEVRDWFARSMTAAAPSTAAGRSPGASTATDR
jgi:hypothetical protein